jgi:hypothetical protein
MHELTGLRLAAYFDVDDDVEGAVLAHPFVIDGDHAVDIRGRVPLQSVFAGEFDTLDHWYGETTREELLKLGEGGIGTAADDRWHHAASVLAKRMDDDLGLARRQEPIQRPRS